MELGELDIPEEFLEAFLDTNVDDPVTFTFEKFCEIHKIEQRNKVKRTWQKIEKELHKVKRKL